MARCNIYAEVRKIVDDLETRLWDDRHPLLCLNGVQLNHIRNELLGRFGNVGCNTYGFTLADDERTTEQLTRDAINQLHRRIVSLEAALLPLAELDDVPIEDDRDVSYRRWVRRTDILVARRLLRMKGGGDAQT